MRARVPWLVRGLSALALLCILSPVARASAAEPAVLVLRSRAFAAEEARLVEALRIYTRDLDCRILVTGEAPLAVPEAAELALRQLRAESGEVAVWVQRRGDGRLVYDLLAANQPELRETEIAPGGAIAAAEAVALKIRTVLSRRAPSVDAPDRPRETAPEAATAAKGAPAAPHPAAEAPAPKVASASSVPPSRSNETPAAPPRAEVPPASAVSPAPKSSPAAPSWLALGAAYGVVIPRDLAWVRHGLMLSAEVRLGPRPLFVVGDASLTFRTENAGPGYSVSLDDLPAGLGLWRRWAPGRWGIAAGPRAGLHVFHVSGVELTDGRVGSVRRVSAGLGAMARVDFSLRDTLRIYGSASLEALIPARNFTLSETRVLATGPGLAGCFVGLLLAVP